MQIYKHIIQIHMFIFTHTFPLNKFTVDILRESMLH
jgi:hypothetical protein